MASTPSRSRYRAVSCTRRNRSTIPWSVRAPISRDQSLIRSLMRTTATIKWGLGKPRKIGWLCWTWMRTTSMKQGIRSSILGIETWLVSVRSSPYLTSWHTSRSCSSSRCTRTTAIGLSLPLTSVCFSRVLSSSSSLHCSWMRVARCTYRWRRRRQIRL